MKLLYVCIIIALAKVKVIQTTSPPSYGPICGCDEPKRCTPKYKEEFDVNMLNSIVIGCNPETVLDVCPCKPNQIKITKCVYDKICHLPEKPDLDCCFDLPSLDEFLCNYPPPNATTCFTRQPTNKKCKCQCH